MRSDIDDKSILTNCSMVRIRTQPFSWMILLMTPIDVLCGESNNLRSETLKRMKGGKAMGPDGIPIEVWRCLGDVAIVWLTKLFNHIFWLNKMPDEWRRSILVPIYKNKGDIQSCTNYRGIKLMSHYYEAMGESYRASLESNNAGLCEPIWFHARKVNHGSHFLNKTSYGAV